MNNLWRLPPDEYKGLPIRCAPNTHAVALSLLTDHTSVRERVLDLAAGSGAWLARLNDAGFDLFTAVELDTKRFEFIQVTPLPLDLNRDFSQKLDSSNFNLITALEIIEHLDCPRNFLKTIHQLLAKDGYLLVTTPNIGHWSGRLRFLASAEHRYFKESDYYEQRHITAITDLHMKLMFREIGYELVAYQTSGSFFGLFKKILLLPMSFFFKAFLGSHTDGDCCIYLVKKTNPDLSLQGSTSFYFQSDT
jgi:SAM-dependent methyltransferase